MSAAKAVGDSCSGGLLAHSHLYLHLPEPGLSHFLLWLQTLVLGGFPSPLLGWLQEIVRLSAHHIHQAPVVGEAIGGRGLFFQFQD